MAGREEGPPGHVGADHRNHPRETGECNLPGHEWSGQPLC